MVELQIMDRVLCPRWGTEEYEIVAMDDKHYTIKNLKTGAVEQFYKAHCHVTHAMAMANRVRRQIWRQERANKIGCPR
jgi:hypothetical protein